MKKNSLKLGMFVVGATLLASAGAFAQTSSSDGAGSTTANRTTTIRTEERQEQPNYSWLGLLGLAGLAGLLKKPERQVIHQTDTVRTTGSGPTTGTGAKY